MIEIKGLKKSFGDLHVLKGLLLESNQTVCALQCSDTLKVIAAPERL